MRHGRGRRARPGAGGQARGRARAALRGGVRLRAAGGRVPRGRRAGAVPARRGPRGAGQGQRAAAAAARGPAGARALPVLRLRLARRAAAGAELALLRRGGRPAGALVLRRRRRASCSPTCPSAGARCRTSPGRPTRRRRPPSGSARSPPAGRGSRTPRPRRSTADALLELLASRGPLSASALERFADCPVKWLVESLLRPEALEPDPEQMVRGAYAHKVLEQTFAALAEETGTRRVTPATCRRPSASCWRWTSTAASSASRPTRRASARRCAGSSSTCCATCATRPRATAGSSRSTWSTASASTTRSSWGRASRCAARSTAWTRGTATRWCATTRPRKRADSLQGGQLGAENRVPGRPLHAGRAPDAGAGAGRRRLHAARWPTSARRAGCCRPTSQEAGLGATRTATACRRRSSRRRWPGRASGSWRRRGTCGPASSDCDPDNCAYDGGCSYPSICRSED